MAPPLRERLGWRTSIEATGRRARRRRGDGPRRLLARASAARSSPCWRSSCPHSRELDEAGWRRPPSRWRAVARAAGADRLRLAPAVGVPRRARRRQRRGHRGDLLLGRRLVVSAPLPFLLPAFFAFLFFPVRAALVARGADRAPCSPSSWSLRDPDYAAVADWVATVGLAGRHRACCSRSCATASAGGSRPGGGRAARPAHRPAEPARLRGRLRRGARARPPDRAEPERDRGRPGRLRAASTTGSATPRATRSCARSAALLESAQAQLGQRGARGRRGVRAAGPGHRRARRLHPGRAHAHRRSSAPSRTRTRRR